MDIAAYGNRNRKELLLEVNAQEVTILLEALTLYRRDHRSTKQSQRAANVQRDLQAAYDRLLLVL